MQVFFFWLAGVHSENSEEKTLYTHEKVEERVSSLLAQNPSLFTLDVFSPSCNPIKAGVNMKAVFWLGITFLTQISRSRFKQSRISMLIPRIYVLGRFVNVLVIFRYIWR